MEWGEKEAVQHTSSCSYMMFSKAKEVIWYSPIVPWKESTERPRDHARGTWTQPQAMKKVPGISHTWAEKRFSLYHKEDNKDWIRENCEQESILTKEENRYSRERLKKNTYGIKWKMKLKWY